MRKLTVDGVLKTFTRTIEQLGAIHDLRHEEARQIERQIILLGNERDEAVIEAERAEAVKDKITRLISDDAEVQ